MLNNKGFAVSTILYTLLIAFLLFLGATLAMFSSSNSIISNANNDLINGTKLSDVQVIEKYNPIDFDDYDSLNNTSKFYVNNKEKFICSNDGGFKWYEKYKKDEKGKIITNNELEKIPNDILVKINSKYGVMYWPRDFLMSPNSYTIGDNTINFGTSDNYNHIHIKFYCNNSSSDDGCSLDDSIKLEIYDEMQQTININIGDVCS